MKPELKVKFLYQMLHRRSGEEGFTLLELLVVVIIVGILSAIALPSFLTQANRARETEARTYVAALNRGQQAYYVEHNRFAPKLTHLELGLSESKSYDTPTIATRSSGQIAIAQLSTSDEFLRDYSGRVWMERDPETGSQTLLLLICEGEPGGIPPNLNNRTDCP